MKEQRLLKKVRRDYNAIAGEFALSRDRLWEEFNYFAPYLKEGEKVLDMGCGNGRLSLFLKQFKLSYLGIDSSSALIKEAQERFPEETFKVGDILAIPETDHLFDKVFSIAVLHHLPTKASRLKALLEIKRVLKKDGLFIFTVWNLWQKKYRKERVKAWLLAIFTFGYYKPKDLFISWGQEKKVKRYYYAFTPEELKELLSKAGFEIVEEFGAKKGEKVDFANSFNWCVISKSKVKRQKSKVKSKSEKFIS